MRDKRWYRTVALRLVEGFSKRFRLAQPNRKGFDRAQPDMNGDWKMALVRGDTNRGSECKKAIVNH